ncbi:MAG: hypothetical protein IJ183_02730 [Prevotella sp.]|nr:hypothetical protein [Prevotella sp.]
MKKILFSAMSLLLMSLCFVSCGDDDETRTDASLLVNGTYELVEMTTTDATAPLVAEPGALTIDISKYDSEGTQANQMSINGTVQNSNNGRNVTVAITDLLMQTSKANGEYLLVYVTAPAMTSSRIQGDLLTCKIKLAAGGKMTAAGKSYTIIARKKTSE